MLNFFRSKQAPVPVDTSFGRMAQRNRLKDVCSYIKTDNPIIIDGGANYGGTIDAFLKFFPHAKIYGFEPQPLMVSRLKDKYKNNNQITILPYAMGASNSILKFNILNFEHSSSLLKPSKINFHYHKEKMNTAQEVEVEVKRTDEVINEKEIDILKLDLQGYELEALKGYEKLLPLTKVITTEIEFIPLYEHQPLFGDIDVYLRSKGFYLLNLYELYTHPDGQLTAGDAVYLNERYFKKYSSDARR